MGNRDADRIRDAVRERYDRIAREAEEGSSGDTCCSCRAQAAPGGAAPQGDEPPPGSDLGLGNDDPLRFALARPGETAIDLGSGAGVDAFRIAQRVGKEGTVIGVDMAEAMLERGRRLAVDHGYRQVEFRRGTIELLPVEDGRADLVVSNCVINLSPEKQAVFREMFRVLRPGGRLSVADIVRVREAPAADSPDMKAHCACQGGAITREAWLRGLESAGFQGAAVRSERPWDGRGEYLSVVITARKPGR
jgi:arsenite methyltransferase